MLWGDTNTQSVSFSVSAGKSQGLDAQLILSSLSASLSLLSKASMGYQNYPLSATFALTQEDHRDGTMHCLFCHLSGDWGDWGDWMRAYLSDKNKSSFHGRMLPQRHQKGHHLGTATCHTGHASYRQGTQSVHLPDLSSHGRRWRRSVQPRIYSQYSVRLILISPNVTDPIASIRSFQTTSSQYMDEYGVSSVAMARHSFLRDK